MKFRQKNNLKSLSEKKRKPVPKWYFVILFLIPVIFFILLEFSLRFFNYGVDNHQWITASEGKIFLNPGIARRYFYNTKRIPYSNQDVFDAKKKSNSFRVFVLGESSAAGYPFSPSGSFSRYLQKRLELLYPSSEIEVVNIGITAINSFTLRDLFPGLIDCQPDLVLIYTGHNEYYGALGVGSMESLGTSREIVNFILYLNKFKTIELLRNIIKEILELFSDDNESASGTLMSRMAKEQYISYNSDIYHKGISQFENNIHDILEMAKEKKIPIILSTLASNLKDQPPFVSIKSEGQPDADFIYTEAKKEFNKENYKKADSLFRYAMDLDGLRFRAPQKINRIIKSLAKEFNYSVINVDSVFASNSPNGIVGNNIMTDHLHPTLEGYQLIGKTFFNKMKEKNFLPKEKPIELTELEQDSITLVNFNFTKLDSVIGDFRIKLLKNDWPFIKKGNTKATWEILITKNIVDSIAAQFLKDGLSWEEAHRKLAAYYLVKKNIDPFLEEMDALIFQFPVVVEYYDYVSNALIQLKDYEKAYKYLESGYKIKPRAFTSKWLGTINLYNDKLDSAEKYLKESLMYDNKDSQVWYNLAGVYVKKKDYKSALEQVNKALALKPKYPEAENLQRQLQSVVK